jgi:hypothetical protein
VSNKQRLLVSSHAEEPAWAVVIDVGAELAWCVCTYIIEAAETQKKVAPDDAYFTNNMEVRAVFIAGFARFGCLARLLHTNVQVADVVAHTVYEKIKHAMHRCCATAALQAAGIDVNGETQRTSQLPCAMFICSNGTSQAPPIPRFYCRR